MREILRWLFNLSGKELDEATAAMSKDTAKQRLKLVLIQDRLELAPEKFNNTKRNIHMKYSGNYIREVFLI